jgi:XRE family transcriptional regulator, regulator of sulfur utilization
MNMNKSSIPLHNYKKFKNLFPLHLHNQIATARKNKGLTQEELAEKANVTIRTIQRIESGETIPRNYTLKSLAAALNIPFEELVLKAQPTTPSNNPPGNDRPEDASHFLHMINLSSFSYLILPFIHFLIPAWLLKKGMQHEPAIIGFGRRLVRTQIYWVVATNLLMLLTVIYNLLIARPAQIQHIHYLWPCFIMYFLNAAIIVSNRYAIKRFMAIRFVSHN